MLGNPKLLPDASVLRQSLSCEVLCVIRLDDRFGNPLSILNEFNTMKLVSDSSKTGFIDLIICNARAWLDFCKLRLELVSALLKNYYRLT